MWNTAAQCMQQYVTVKLFLKYITQSIIPAAQWSVSARAEGFKVRDPAAGARVLAALCQINAPCINHLKGTLPGSSACSRGRWRACSWPAGWPAQCWRRVKVRLPQGADQPLSQRSPRDDQGERSRAGGGGYFCSRRHVECKHLFQMRGTVKMIILWTHPPSVLLWFPGRAPSSCLPCLAVGAGCREHHRSLSQSERGGSQRAATHCCYPTQ